MKKQKGRDTAKYFLYGEQEREGATEKIYIYGVGEKPKLEQSYFKEYYPIGYLKIKQEKAFWKALNEFNYEIGELYSVYIDEGSSIIISIGYFTWDISEESFIFNGLRFICYKNKDKKEDTDSDKIDFDKTDSIILLVFGIAMLISIIIAAVCSYY